MTSPGQLSLSAQELKSILLLGTSTYYDYTHIK